MTVHVPDPKRSRAFLVGVPTVTEGGFEPLDYVDRNLDDLRAALSHPDRGILPPEAITVLRSPSQREWLRKLKRVAEETSDLLLFYFVGHGYRGPLDNELYLMTRDADLDVNLAATAVPWSHVLGTLDGLGFQRAVAILDCCNSGLAAEGRGVGLGHYILSSALPTKTQPSGSVERRSRFTHEIIRAMEEPEPGGLTMQRLYDILFAATPTWQPVGFGDGWGPKGGSGGDGPHIVISRFAEPDPEPGPGARPGSSLSGNLFQEPVIAPRSERPAPAEPAPAPTLPRTLSGWRRLLGVLPRGIRGRSGTEARPSPGMPSPREAGARHSRPPGRWKTLLAVAVALLVTLSIGVYAVRSDDGTDASGCPPPLELRLMTGIETRAAVARAVTAYRNDDANREPLGHADHAPKHCRRTNITVFEAGTGETVDAFGATAAWAGRGDEGGHHPAVAGGGQGSGGSPSGVTPLGPAAGACPTSSPGDRQTVEPGKTEEPGKPDTGGLCFDPLQDVGPQPDLVVAGSSTELGRMQAQLTRAPGPAEVERIGSLGYSPLVLAVPAKLEKKLAAAGVQRTGSTWERLLTAMKEAAPGMPLLRPDPDTSGVGLQHTVGLYEAYDGWFAGGEARDAEAVEERLRHDAVPATDADSLLCALDRGEPGQPRLGQAAALVSEKAVADFNLGRRPGSVCGNSKPADDTSRLLAYYPAGVPALDMPLATVRWKRSAASSGSEDRDRRAEAIRHFHTWLTQEGRPHFLHGLARGAGANGQPLPPRGEAWADTGTSGVLKDVSVVTEQTDGPTSDAVVADYTRTREPGQVLFLVDVSGSMAEGGGKRALVDAALRRSLQRLGPRDTYGIWSYPKSAHQPDLARTEIERGTPGDERAAALEWTDSLAKKRMSTSGAAVFEVLTRAMRETRDDPRPLIVLITDGDDRPEGDAGGAEFTAMRQEQQRAGSTDVLVLSVRLDGCTAQIRQFENPGGAGCFAGRPDRAAEALAEQVANDVQGGSGDEGP